jgi:ankyrin repeat protein
MPSQAEDAIRTISASATQLGNQISVHMLNYLSTTQQLPDGFRELSHTFLDTCRTLWAIETGVTELTAANRALPEVIIDEVEKKFVVAYREFQQLDKVILKLVQYEHRGTLGKLQRGWHRPAHELKRIHESLKKTNETLQISGMAFHWSLREVQPEESVGIGYASLAAALDRISKGRSIMGINKVASFDNSGPGPSLRTQSFESDGSSPSVPSKDSSPLRGAPREYQPEESSQGTFPRQDRGSYGDDVSSILSLNQFLSSQPGREPQTIPPREQQSMPYRPAKTSAPASVAETSIRHEGESDTLPPRLSSKMAGGSSTTIRNNLSSAMRERDHTSIEQLLKSGVSPDQEGDFYPLLEAVNQRDIESLRLLLAFEANPNLAEPQGKTPLLLTVEEGFVDGAMLLLKHGADANYRANEKLESPLSCSINKRNIKLAQFMLSHGGNPNEETPSGTTLLIDLIRKQAPEQLVQILLEAGCDPNRKDNHGKTALCEAVHDDQPGIVTILLDHHANPNLPGPEHALWPAVYRPACLRILLARGADIRKAPGIMEQATSVNNIDAVRVLLEAGIDPNSKKDGIYTPLCSAIRDDRPDIITLLLSHGADPNLMASEYPAWKCITHNRLEFLPELIAAGADLHTPPGIVECAVQLNNSTAMHWLVEEGGANPNDRNASGHTAITTAIRDNRPEVLEWLLAHGADPNVRGQDWPIYMAVQSPALLRLLLPGIKDLGAHKGVMEKAVQANHLENVKLLLEAGANIEWKNGGVFSPLTTALRERHADIVRYLLGDGHADPNAPGEHLPLVKAIRRCDDGDFSMIELLLEKGADPNKCYRDWNAIMQAIEDRDLNLLRLLIVKGGSVDVEKKDETGQTVLEMAEASGWPEGVRLLIDNSRK